MPVKFAYSLCLFGQGEKLDEDFSFSICGFFLVY